LREGHGISLFEKRMLRNIFVSKRDEVRRDWKRICNEKFRDLYFTPDIIGVIKARSMGWGHECKEDFGR
jgi:hypothetical protein